MIVENRLKYLYALQQVDTSLQEIRELKGDLPAIVAELEEKVDASKARLKELQTSVKQAKVERDNADLEIVDLAGKIEKYKNQQLQIKSNKQYDALTREIEAAQVRSGKLEKEMESFEGRMETAKTDIDAITVQLDEVSKEYDERKKELREVNKEHEKEELKLQHEREKLVARVEKADLARYERIRKAKGGTAIVPIKREACGGCFSRVPPQKILEIRQNSRIDQCEHCGRILVSDQVVEMGHTLAL